ncbi:MAG: hypothetical protein ACRYFX_09905 [Janthinobacterium lividum]
MAAADLLDRIQAALTGGAATPTDTLQALLLEVAHETCYRRGRLLHRLTAILTSQRPPMATSTTHRFKAAFAHKDFSGFPLVVGDQTKLVTATNLADEDVALLQRHGGGHLIEAVPTSGPEADVADLDQQIADLTAKRTALLTPAVVEPAVTNSGILLTAVETDGTSTTIKHSEGGPDDQAITEPVNKPNATEPPKPTEPADLHKLHKPELQTKYKQVLGKDADEKLTKEELIKAIEAGPDKA